MTNPAAAEGEWQAKLEELQAEHQLELLHQQEEHLRLLQQLKAQLLQDLASEGEAAMLIDTSELFQSLFLTEETHPRSVSRTTEGSRVPLQAQAGPEPQPVSPPRCAPAASTETFMARCSEASTPLASSPTPSPSRVGEHPAGQQRRDDSQLSNFRAPTREEWLHQLSQTPAPSREPPCHLTPTVNSSSEVRRAALMEKHTRHVKDLRDYYEAELSELRRQLEEALEDRGERAVVRRDSLSQGNGNGVGSGEEGPATEVAKLQARCAELQQLHEEDVRERQALEVHMHKLQQYAERYEALERETGLLQERLGAMQSSLEQREEEAGSLREEVAGLREELNSCQEQRVQDLESVEQVLKEFEALQQEDERLHEANTSLENTIAELNQELGTLRAMVGRYEAAEEQYKSTIIGLEEEVRHLQHINNRLHSQMTHYTLSDGDTHGRASSACSSPRTAGHTPSQQRVSPRCQAHTPPTSAAPAVAEQGPSSQKLTRRKWLEPSEPGLIFGQDQGHDGENQVPHQVPQSRGKTRTPSRFGVEDRTPPVQSTTLRVKDDGDTGTAELSLRSIQSGRILATEPNTSRRPKDDHTPLRKGTAADITGLEECVERNMTQVVAKAEHKMVELQKEKEKLQSALQRIPRCSSGRFTLHGKQDQLQMEARLDEVDKEIGAVRMTLRNHHAL